MRSDKFSGLQSFGDVQVTSPPSRATSYVGRVGGLAAALGVGAAILGSAGVAVADNGAGDSADSAGVESPRSAQSGSATSKAQTGSQRGAQRGGLNVGGSPAPAAAVGARVAAGNSDNPMPTASHRVASSPFVVGALKPQSAGSPLLNAVRQALSGAPQHASVFGGIGGNGLNSMKSKLAGVVANVVKDALSSVIADGAPAISAALQGDAAAPADAPVMTALARVKDMLTADGPLALLGLGGGSGSPGSAPLEWAALASARREDLAGATPQVAAADVVSSGEPAASVADPVVDAPAAQTFAAATALQIDPADVPASNTAEVGLTSAATPDPAAAAVGARDMSITSISPSQAAVGDTITIKGVGLKGQGTPAYPVNAVYFGCGIDSCSSPASASPISVTADTVTVKVPKGAVTGHIAVHTAIGGPSDAYSTQVLTIPGTPAITSFEGVDSSGTGIINASGEVSINVVNLGSVNSVKFDGTAAEHFSVNQAGTVVTAKVPDNVAESKITGAIAIATTGGTVISPTNYTVAVAPLPDLSPCKGLNCTALNAARGLAINAISAAIQDALPTTGPALPCSKNGCPIPPGQTTASVADTIAMYAFNVIYSLSGPTSSDPAVVNQVIGNTVVALATQPNVLNFISETVAGNKALSKLPPSVANLVGDAAANFVQMTFGNETVAAAFAPFLLSLNLSNPKLSFITNIKSNPKKALLDQFDEKQQKVGQAALVTFFQNSSVQQIFGQALASSINELLGMPSPGGVGDTALSSYLGQVAASKLLNQPVPDTNPLAVSIGDTIQSLFDTVGPVVATDAGTALTDLLNEPAMDGQPAVATTLANVFVNEFVEALGGTAPFPVPDGLLPALAPAAGVVVNGFTNSVLSSSTVTTGLGQFITQLVPEVLADQQIQDEIDTTVTALVSLALGDDLGPVVAPQVATAVLDLVTDTTVSGALTTFVSTAFGTMLGSDGVVTAVSDVAGGFATAVLSGSTVSEASKAAQDALKANSYIDDGVGAGVTAAVTGLLSNKAAWADVDATVSTLVGELLTDSGVQDALAAAVAGRVSKKIPGPLGDLVGARVGAAVVSFVTQPLVEGALHSLVDSVFTDFFGTAGVPAAFGQVAGQIVVAKLTGTPPPNAYLELASNADVQAGLQASVGDAVTELLSNGALWHALDSTVVSLVSGLLNDPVVGQALYQTVSTSVTGALDKLGFTELGAEVGPQVAGAVLSLVLNPAFGTGLNNLVDTLFTDFFSTQGVVSAFSGAASQLALVLFTGGDFAAAKKAAQEELAADPAIDAGMDNSVSAAVAGLVGDIAFWQAVGGPVGGLITDLIGDPGVPEFLGSTVGDLVETMLKKNANIAPIAGPISQAVGAAVGQFLGAPGVASELGAVIGSVLPVFFGQAGVADVLGQLAGEFAAAQLTGDTPPAVITILRANTDIQNAAGVTVTDVVEQLLGDTAVTQALGGALDVVVSDVLRDTAVQKYAETKVAAFVESLAGPVIGDDVGTAVYRFLSAPDVATDLGAALGSVLPVFFAQPGVVDALGEVAGAVAVAGVAGDPAPDVLATLRANTEVQAAVGVTAQAAMEQLVPDAAVWTGLGNAVGGLVTDLVGMSSVQDLAGAAVAELVTERLKESATTAAIAGLVGDAAGTAMQQFLAAPGVAADLGVVIGTVLPNFFAQPGIAEPLGVAVGALAEAKFAGDDMPDVLTGLRASTDIQNAVGVTVQDAVEQLVVDNEVWLGLGGALDGFVTDVVGIPGVQQVANETVAGFVTTLLNKTPATASIAGPIGQAAGAAVQNFLAAPGVAADLGAVFGALVPDFFSQPGVVDALGEAAGALAAAGVAGDGAVTQLLPDVVAGLRANTDIQNAVGVTVGDAVEQLVGEEAVWPAMGAALGGLTTEIVGNSAVQKYAGAEVTALVTETLAKNPATAGIAAKVGEAAGAAVQMLMANPVVAAGLGAVVAAVVPDFFGQTGVGAALGQAADTLAAAWVAGDVTTVLPGVLDSLKSNPEVIAALKVTAFDALTLIGTDLLNDPAFDAALGSIVGTLTTDVLGDPVVQTFIGDRLGPPLGDAVVVLLAAPGVSAAVGEVVGSSVSAFLEYPGFTKAVTDSLDQFVNAVLDGAPRAEALQAALAGLEASVAYQNAVGTILPAALDSLFGNSVVRQAMGEAAKVYVMDYLQTTFLKNKFVGKVAGTVAEGTVDSLLQQAAMVNLIDTIVVDVLDGMPLADVNALVIHEVLHEPSLQVALGMSLGDGIGALFGNNIVGYLVGEIVGATLVLQISLVAGIYKIFTGGGPDLPVWGPPAAAAVAAGDYPTPAVGEPYAMAVAAPDGYDLASLSSIASTAQFTLGDFAVTGLDQSGQANFLDITMSIQGSAGASDGLEQGGGETNAPVMVSFRFRLDSLLTAMEPQSFATAERRRTFQHA